MSAVKEHRIIEDPEGGHKAAEILLGEIVLFFSEVIDHYFSCQDVLNPLELLETRLGYRKRVLRNKAPPYPVMVSRCQSPNKSPERILVHG